MPPQAKRLLKHNPEKLQTFRSRLCVKPLAGRFAAVLANFRDFLRELIVEIVGRAGDDNIADQRIGRALHPELLGKGAILGESILHCGVFHVLLQLLDIEPELLGDL